MGIRKASSFSNFNTENNTHVKTEMTSNSPTVIISTREKDSNKTKNLEKTKIKENSTEQKANLSKLKTSTQLRKHSAPDIIGFLSQPIGTISGFNVPTNANFFCPTKWDFEKNELTRQNTQLTQQLSVLKNKLKLALEKQSKVNHQSFNGFKNVEQKNKKECENSLEKEQEQNTNDEKKLISLLHKIYAELESILDQKKTKHESNNCRNYKDIIEITDSANLNLNMSVESFATLSKLKVTNQHLQKLLHDAEMELEIYRKEPRQEMNNLLGRSLSAAELSALDSTSLTQNEIKK